MSLFHILNSVKIFLAFLTNGVSLDWNQMAVCGGVSGKNRGLTYC